MRGRLFVLAQAVLLAVVATAPFWAAWPVEWQPTAVLVGVGAAVLAAGLVVTVVGLLHLGEALTPLPEPRPDASMVATGLYRWVRHPVYSGVLASAVGWTVIRPSVAGVAATAALVVLLGAKSRYEERLLRERYPGYAEYAASTPRFLPRWRASGR